MITFLHGRLVDALPTQVTVDVGGVGYEVLIPLSSFDRLPAPGAEVHLLTHLSIREDAHLLYGFATASERDLFRLLIHTVSGIGPRIALNILSGMPAADFRIAVATGDIKALSRLSGVGKKTAERIVVELKDKVGGGLPAPGNPTARAPAPEERAVQDALLALLALGYRAPDAQETIRAAQAVLGPQASVEQLVRAALRKGTGG